jgi:hypothetical protein
MTQAKPTVIIFLPIFLMFSPRFTCVKEKRNAVTLKFSAPGEAQLSGIQEICWRGLR